jgi:hypothetical protein
MKEGRPTTLFYLDEVLLKMQTTDTANISVVVNSLGR